MTDQELTRRLEELEARFAFQEQTIEDLNQAVTAQMTEIAELKRRLGMMGEQIREIGEHPALAQAPEPPPPHY